MRFGDMTWHLQLVAIWWIIAVLAIAVVLWLWPNERWSKESPAQALKRGYATGGNRRKAYQHMLQELRK